MKKKRYLETKRNWYIKNRELVLQKRYMDKHGTLEGYEPRECKYYKKPKKKEEALKVPYIPSEGVVLLPVNDGLIIRF